MKIKNYQKHQHFKNRRPPWIKLHREILDQRDIMALSDRAFKVLICTWLIASEDKNMSGNLPSLFDISWRLRMPEKDLVKVFQELNAFVLQDDNALISERHQVDAPETETETYTEKETETKKTTRKRAGSTLLNTPLFEVFWDAYPRKVGYGKALEAWGKINPDETLTAEIVAAVEAQKKGVAWLKDNGQFIPHPTTWLNQKRWKDSVDGKQYTASDDGGLNQWITNDD